MANGAAMKKQQRQLNDAAMRNMVLTCALVVLTLQPCRTDAQGLSLNFYRNSCPGAYAAVRKVVDDYISRAPSLAAPLLRMHFHDCFVQGCDGSVLLNSTSATQRAEKDAPPNQTLRGFHVIDAAKAAVEKLCPRTVSCADVLALVARDAVLKIGGPSWEVKTGRRDGAISSANEALANLPPPSANFTTLKRLFGAKGLSVKDLVALSGSHTIGTSHCSAFSNRLFNFSGKGDMDPSWDPRFAAQLKKKCGDGNRLVEMDPGSFRTFDAHYFLNLRKRRVLFESDAALLADGEAASYVKAFASADSESVFMREFAESMEKMGSVGVLTGSSGQIRRHCALVNS